MPPRERNQFPGPLFMAGNYLTFLLGFCANLLIMGGVAAVFLHLFPAPSGWRLLGMALVLGGLFEAKRHVDNVVAVLMIALRHRMGWWPSDAPLPPPPPPAEPEPSFDTIFPGVDDQFKNAMVLVNDEDRVVDNRLFGHIEVAKDVQKQIPFPTRIVALRITRMDRA